METKSKKILSITRSQFQANSLKILKRTEDNKTPVFITKYGFPTHIILPLDMARITQYEQIPVEKYLNDALAQWGPEPTKPETSHNTKEKQYGNNSTTKTTT